MIGERILVVEDESIIARDIINRLNTANYTTVGLASSGEEAVALAVETQPDLILMDIRLQGDLDGIDAAIKIRAQNPIPVIFITAFADKATLERAGQSEPFGYLIKPFTNQELFTTIQLALYRHRTEQRIKTIERMFYTSIVNAQEVERRRISQELHDDVGQALTAVHINLVRVTQDLGAEIPGVVHERIAESIELIDDVFSKTKELSRTLWPTLLNDLGLVSALRSYSQDFAKRLGIEVMISSTGFDEGAATDAEAVLYRIGQEALTNVAKHADAQHVMIVLNCDASHLTMKISDDGQGFDPQESRRRSINHGGLGLRIMRERCAFLGGSFAIQSQPGSGTTVTAQLPIDIPGDTQSS